MKLPCEMVQDILPLYHDGVCSEVSKNLVEEHLRGCEQCADFLKGIDVEIEAPVDAAEAQPLQAIKKTWGKEKKRALLKGIAVTSLIVVLLVGVLLFVALFYGIGMVFPWAFLRETCSEMNIAVIHTCFNVAATAVLLPMNGLLVKLATLSVPDDKTEEQTELLDERLLGTPAVAIQRAHEIAVQMAEKSCEAMTLAMGLTRSFDAKILEKVAALEEETEC